MRQVVEHLGSWLYFMRITFICKHETGSQVHYVKNIFSFNFWDISKPIHI